MSSTVGEVKIALKLDGSGLNAGAGKTLGSAFGNAWTVASGNLISAGLSALMATAVQVGKEIISTGMSYEKAMSEVKAISGATADELDKLSTQALKSAKTTIFTSSEVASAYKYMAMAGWDVEEMMAGLDGILNLAAASNLDLARTSDIVTDALTAFGYQASESAHFADVLARVATNANTNVDLMGESFKYVGAIAGTMKYSIEDVGVALGLMANAGIKASQAGTSLRSIISRMAAPTDKVKTAMDELGITMTNSKGEAKSFEEVMKDLRKGFAGLSESQKTQYASTIAGKNAMTGLLAIINSSDEDFDKLTTAIDDSKNAAQDMADTMKDNLSGDVTELNSKLDVLYVNLYEKIEPVLRGIVQFLGQVVDVVSSVIEVVGGVVEAISQNEIAMTLIQGVIKGVLGTMTNFIGVVSNVINVFQSLSGVVESAKGVFENFKGGFDGVVEKVKQGAGNIGTKFGEMKDTIGSAIGNALDKVKEWGGNMFETAKKVGGDFLSGIATFFAELPGKVWNFLVETVKKVGEFAINMAEKAEEAAKNTFETIANKIGELPGKMLEIGKQIVEGLWNGITGMADWVADKVSGFANGVVDTVKNALGIHSPSKVMADQVGANIAKGVIEGVNKEMPKVKSNAVKLSNAYVSAAKSRVKEMEKANQITLTQEVGYWNKIISAVSKGTKAYKSAVSQLKTVKSKLKTEVKDLTADYIQDTAKVYKNLQSDIEKVNSQLAKEIESLEKEYTSAVSSRANSIMNSVGLFSKVSFDKQLSSSTLIENLSGQVDALKQWDETLNSLEKRIGKSALIEELKGMGVSSLKTLESINAMSEDELNTYISLYAQKSAIAQDRATRENAELRQTIDQQISALRTEAQQQIKELETAAKKEIDTLTKEYKKGLKELGVVANKSSKEVGKQIASGIDSALKEEMPKVQASLVSQVKAMVAAAKKALKIKSPSQVFRDEVGQMMAEGLRNGFVEGMEGATAEMTNAIPEPEFETRMTSLAQMALDMGEETEQMETENQPLIVNLEMDGQQIQQVILQDIRRSA